MPQILSISQVNEYIRGKMDEDLFLNAVAVKGEISNYKLYPSGHHYFTLKDDASSLKCVMFKGNAFRLRFHPENGMKIIAMGKISVYPRDGAYQLYCNAMTVDGIGDLHAAYEQLKKKLAAQGYFDPAHKKSIPEYPGTIGIITSAAGAAVHDMLRILRKRYPLTQVKLLPVRVQGAEAPGEVAAAIQYANRFHLADLLIVGRGGGSIEDLWAFNDEHVAKAIYDSEIPIISAVGHEPDVTISDYVADLRAATPSNAAELAVPDQAHLQQQLDAISNQMAASLNRQIKAARNNLNALSAGSALRGPQVYLDQRRNTLELMKSHMIAAQTASLNKLRNRFLENTSKLDVMSPLKVLSRGYSVIQNAKGEVIRAVCQVQTGDSIRVNLSDGSIHASVVEIKEETL